MADFTHSKAESLETGKPFLFYPFFKEPDRKDRWRLKGFLFDKKKIPTVHVDGYLDDPSIIVNYIGSNTPFFVNRTIDTEFYLGEAYPLFTDVRFERDYYTSHVLSGYSYLLQMDKSKFHISQFQKEKCRLSLQKQRV